MRYITVNNKLVLVDGKPIIPPNEPETQEKTIDVAANGTYTVEPDSGKTLSKVTANINVPSSSPITPVAPSDITFYDYDGTVIEAWTLAELATKTALPNYPIHEGLTCQGWNWSLADLKTTNRKMNVGAMYITDDGKTRIYIRLEEGRTSPMLGVCPNGTVTVDWGDETTPDTLTGTSTTAVKWTPNHAYDTPGEYVIKLTVNGTMGFYGSLESLGTILQYSSNYDSRNYAYKNSVLGMIDAMNQKSEDLKIDGEALQKVIGDPENLTLVKQILDNLG